MKNILLIIITACFSSCTLFPLCIVKNDNCGCDKSRNIKLGQRTKNKMTIDWDENYVLLLKKRKTLRKLQKYANEKQSRDLYKTQDTLKIEVMKINFW